MAILGIIFITLGVTNGAHLLSLLVFLIGIDLLYHSSTMTFSQWAKTREKQFNNFLKG